MPESAGFLPKDHVIGIILSAPLEQTPEINTALFIVASAFHGKKTWDGGDYIMHCLYVGMTDTQSREKMVIGVLHDLIEDTDWTLDDLRSVGFSERIVQGVDGMTRRKGEAYFDFIRRCSLNPDSTSRKLQDLDHNMKGSRLVNFLTDEQVEKQRAYVVSYQYLVAVRQGKIKPGSSMADFMDKSPNIKDIELLKKFSTEQPKYLPVPFQAPKPHVPI